MAEKIPIDWIKVDNLLASGCRGMEVAATIGIHEDTLYNRVKSEKGMQFSAYSAEKRAKGEALLRAQQFAKAIGWSKKGDNMMLIWLGKNRLDQSDQRQQDTSTNEQVISGTLDLAKLKAENAELKRLLNESKTGTIDIPSDKTSEHMVRSGSEREDLQQHLQTD